MLFKSGQFKIAVYIFFLASCLGQEQFRSCERNNERNIEQVLRTDPSDLREWHRFRYENFEKEESRLPMNQDFNENHDRRADRERLSEQAHREEPKKDERQIRSDVTRHLNDKTDEQRECLRRLSVQDEERLLDTRREQSVSLRQMNAYDETNQERRKTLARLDNRDIQRRSDDNREERRENLRQLDLESQRLDERFRHRDQSLTPRYDETKQNREQRAITLRSDNSKPLFDTRKPSDVARDFRDDEQLSQTQRRFENGEKREERYEISRRLVEPQYQREESDHKIRSETLKQFDDYTEQRKVDRRNEHELEQRRDENKREGSINRRLSDDIRNNREVEADRSTPSERETRDVRERFAKSRISHRNVVRFLDDNREDTTRQFINRKIQQDVSIRSENIREIRRGAQRDINRRLEGNLQVRQDIVRRTNDNNSERDTSRNSEVDLSSRSLSERESMTRRSQNQFERKREDREVQRYVSRQSEDKRNEFHQIFEGIDERETHHDSQRSNELLSQRKQESAQYQDDIRESLRLVNRANERYPINRRDEDEQKLRNRYETSKRVDERETPNDLGRRSEIKRESQSEIERSSRREHETNQRQNRVEQRYEERNIQSDASSSSEVRREERHDTMRRHDDRQNLQETFRRETELDVSRRSGEGFYSRRLDKRLSLTDRKLIQHRDEIMSERVDRREDRFKREAQRDINRRLDGSREEYYQMTAQLGERDVKQRLDDAHDTQRLNGNTYQRERRSIERHDINNDDRKVQRDISRRLEKSRYNELEENYVNRRMDAEQKSPLSNRYLSQVERENQEKEVVQFNTKHTFTHKQRNCNANYMILGQGVILGYVIMKTLNGKNDFKNQLFVKLQEGLEIIGVF